MKKKNQLSAELSNIVRDPKVIIPVIAVMLVPLLYSALFLGAFWDPYARLDKVPVAVVNEDAGAELNGERIAIGEQFIAKLKESDDFAWSFLSREEALAGIENNEYYMMLEIPTRFSEQALSLTSDEPEQAELIYTPNEAYNFLASQIGSTAVSELTARLNQQITETYVSSIYDKLGEAIEGLGAASEGALQIADGAEAASEGATELLVGQQSLGAGLQKLQSGAGALQAGGNELVTGLTALKDGAHHLNAGLTELQQAGQGLQQGIGQLHKQYEELNKGMLQSSEGTTQLKQAALGIEAALQQLSSAQPQLAESESFQQILAGSQSLAQGLLAKEQGESKLVAGSQAVVNGLTKLAGGSTELAAGITQASDGARQLSTGANAALTGGVKLSEGMTTLHKSTSQLIDGNQKLQAGQEQLISGLDKLHSGALELSDKLGNVNGESLNLTLTEQMKQQFAKPVKVETQAYNEVPNYGTGFSPYFISLGLYVGCMLLTIVYSMRKPTQLPASSTSWYASKTMTVLMIATVQAVILGVAMLFILDLEVLHLGAYLAMMIVTSVAFMMLIQLLCTVLNDVGRFIAIVLLILQLTSSAGTFPLELVPNWLQAINPLLPMTYSVVGLKQAISSADMNLYGENLAILLLFAFVCSLLTFVYMKLGFRKFTNLQEGSAAGE